MGAWRCEYVNIDPMSLIDGMNAWIKNVFNVNGLVLFLCALVAFTNTGERVFDDGVLGVVHRCQVLGEQNSGVVWVLGGVGAEIHTGVLDDLVNAVSKTGDNGLKIGSQLGDVDAFDRRVAGFNKPIGEIDSILIK